jgi:maleylacetoacetate isomerase
MKLVLYHYWRSSSSFRVRFGLAMKRLAYESRTVDLLSNEQSAPEHLLRSPMGRVPCLVIDGRPLTESIAILEYLEEIAPEPALLPADPWDRARVREVAQMINSGIQPLHNSGVLARVSSDVETQRAWAAEWIGRGLHALERALESIAKERGQGRYAVGDSLTLADICIVPQVYQARRYGAPLEPYPRTIAACEAAMQSEAAIAAAPERQPGAPQ